MTNHALQPALRRTITVLGALVLMAPAGACSAPTGQQSAATTSVAPTSSTPTPTTSSPAPTTTSPTPTTPPTTNPTPTVTPKPKPTYRILLRPGDRGPKVRELQARLRQIRWFDGDVTDFYGPRTTAAVKGFQAKRGFPVTGSVDERTWSRLLSMTRTPTRDELNNVRPPAEISWDVDKRCLTGRVMCISKSTRELTWVIDGVPQYEMDVRFGSEEYPTREGTFSVYKKMEYVYSELYDSPMPYSMFFSGGQAVHYSSNFARIGYDGASHGCVNVRDWNAVKRLYYDSRIGDKVVVHW